MDFKKEIEWYIDEGYGNPFDITPVINKPLIINAALTGMMPRKKDNPYLPVTPEEIINDAEKCFNAGASILHLHARDENEVPTYKAAAYKEFIPEIRRRCPDVIVCVTTSGRLFNEFKYRSEVLSMVNDSKPDMASITLGSLNFPKQASVTSPDMIKKLAECMLKNSIIPELEVFEMGMANYALYLEKKGLIKTPCWTNFLLGSLGTIPARIRDLNYLTNDLPPDYNWAAAGIGDFQLPINLTAIIKGGHVRVGLEDNIFYDHKRTVFATNEMLIKRLVKFSELIGRPIATPIQARKTIGLI